KVVLWLAQSQFPCKTHDLPKELLHLRQFGLSIQWCEDLKSLKKIIPSLRSYPDDVIVTADDDIMYPPYWLEHLYAAHQKNPSYVQARMAYSVPLGTEDEIAAYPGYAGEKEDVLPFSYTPSGWGGVLYPPHSLHEETTPTDIAMKIAPYDDEIWCWAMMVLQGTRLHAIKGDWDDLIRLRIPGSLSLRGRGLNIYVLMLKTYPKIREIFVAEGHTLPEDLFKSVADDGQ
ncbi:MAG: hypothetical protein LBF76_03180, partial [Holosporales bacterium]|nr:hypothetical protein [Holosporales bacterium]